MAITDHKTLRRVCQWAYPGRFVSASESWDGKEDVQSYIDRAWSWSGEPVSAADIMAQEDAYMSATSGTQEKNVARNDIRAVAAQGSMFVLVELIDQLLTNKTISASDFSTGTRQIYQKLRASVMASR